MAYIIADNIISPLGNDSATNYAAIKKGLSHLKVYKGAETGVGDDYCASVMEDFSPMEGFSRYESKAIASITQALKSADISIGGGRTLLIMSSTKGNIELLGKDCDEKEVNMGESARRIARRFGIETTPVTVCNACISGLAAIILAQRLIDAGEYDCVIVCGTDDIGRFVVSGFESLKAMSAEECRPFDLERNGLNLGEAVGTVVMASKGGEDDWQITAGAVRNDAYHLTTPARNAEGLYGCIRHVKETAGMEEISFLNVHGTATLFNDQMEATAIRRAGMGEIPMNGLKGCLGHTLGAAGVVETILSMAAADDGTVLGTRGFETLGVGGKPNIAAENRPLDENKGFLKMLSGFGGANAAAFFTRRKAKEGKCCHDVRLRRTHTVSITPQEASVDGKKITSPLNAQRSTLNAQCSPSHSLTNIYKEYVGDYPKFYKMDGLCKLGFLASELLLKAEGKERNAEGESRAVVLFNRTSSIDADRRYSESICGAEGYFPSPSAFVYTLPNIVTGEIAMRNLMHGETAFYVLPEEDWQMMERIMRATAADHNTQSIIGGWVDYEGEDCYKADIAIYEMERL